MVVDDWPPPDYKYRRARAPIVHPFLLLFFFLTLAPPYANGADLPVFCGREGEGSPRGSRSSPAEEAPRPRPLRRDRMVGDVAALVRSGAAWVSAALVCLNRGTWRRRSRATPTTPTASPASHGGAHCHPWRPRRGLFPQVRASHRASHRYASVLLDSPSSLLRL